MVQVTYPGVYVVEVPSGVHTITGVATSITAFFGRASRGPMNKAVPVLSVADYDRNFGAPHPSSDLAQSVQQFFGNGGAQCYVVRLAHGATKASVTLQNLAGQNVLVVRASFEGLAGNGIRLQVDYDTPNPDETFNLLVSSEESGVVVSQEAFSNLSMDPTSPRFAPAFVTQSSTLVGLSLHGDMLAADFINQIGNTPAAYSQSRAPLPNAIAGLRAAFSDPAKTSFDLSVNGSEWNTIDLGTPTIRAQITGAADSGVLAGRLQTAINGVLGSAAPGLQVQCAFDTVGANNLLLRITSDSDRKSSVHVRRAAQNDLAGSLMLGLDQGGIEEVRYSNMRPVFTGSAFTAYPGGGVTSFGSIATGATGLALIAQSAITQITLDAHAPIPLALVTSAPADLWYLDAAGRSDGVRQRLQMIADAVTGDATVPYAAARWGYHLAFVPRAPGSINDIATTIMTGTAALDNGITKNVRKYTLGNTGASPAQLLPGTRGLDGSFPQFSDYVGNELLQTGLHALDSVDLFNLMVLPGDAEVTESEYEQIIGPASTYCEDHRAFLLIDAPPAWTSAAGRPVAQASDVNTLRALVSQNHSAVFYPRIIYSDLGIKRSIGPAGMIAGLMSRIDSTRGVWKTPAGVEADLRGVLDLEVNLTDRENGVLNKLGVDVIRKFPAGFVNWGGRTLQGSDDLASEWKYIAIRRTALFLEESLFRGTKWVVFEPNDEPLWAQIRLNLRAFMMGLFRQGAFQGSSPDKAFYVKCDSETTTPNDQNLGIVNIEVGFAPLKPAEFVVIRVKQIAPDLAA